MELPTFTTGFSVGRAPALGRGDMVFRADSSCGFGGASEAPSGDATSPGVASTLVSAFGACGFESERVGTAGGSAFEGLVTTLDSVRSGVLSGSGDLSFA